MDDRESLLRAIAANPAEDTPRLAYADLLDELGGSANAARARFIRLQIETHHGPGDTGGTWLFDRQCAEIDMLGVQYGKQWLAELPTWASAAGYSSVTSHAFNRGFLEQVAINLRDVPGEFEFLELHPLKALSVNAASFAQLTALLKCPGLARLRTLAFQASAFRDAHLHEIACSPYLSGLEKLDVGSCLVSDRGLMALAQSEALAELRVLRLDCTGKGLTESGIASLLTSPRLPKLQEIDLCHRRRQFWQSTNLRARFPNVDGL